ncbi:MAG: redoxin domain-containing protein, partial [Pricia sp.]|nr:redoxin domain-containing protein [Pricia sp.]
MKPKKEVPELQLPLINDMQWRLYSQESDAFTLLVFYRGWHCPVCKKYLENLATKLEDFSKRGVHTIAISCDNEERAKKSGEEWNIPELPVAYGLSIEGAKEWGLY